MTPKDTAVAESPYFIELFERARQALAEHVGPGTAAVLHEPGTAVPGDGPHIAAQLHVDERTRAVVVRFYDVQTGSTLGELAPQTVAAAARAAASAV